MTDPQQLWNYMVNKPASNDSLDFFVDIMDPNVYMNCNLCEPTMDPLSAQMDLETLKNQWVMRTPVTQCSTHGHLEGVLLRNMSPWPSSLGETISFNGLTHWC